MGSAALPGALVISLDFELRWGVRDHCAPGSRYDRNLFGAREVIPRLLDLFDEFGLKATWATVGLLFAKDRAEAQRFRPALLPEYEDQRLNAFTEQLGENEETDPLHFAPSLLDQIQATRGQEIGTHTFSHFFCNEAGVTRASFAADLQAARAIALSRGVELRSIVFPRNQYNPSFSDVLQEQGIRAYRGNPESWMWRFSNRSESNGIFRRGGRVVDAYVNISRHDTFGWNEITQENGLADVRATHFVRPFNPRLRGLEPLRAGRLRGAVRQAARRRRLVHLWWHPHNFGLHQGECLRLLRGILEEFARCREVYGMESLTMNEVAERAAALPRERAGRRSESPLPR